MSMHIDPQATGNLLWFGNTVVSVKLSSQSGSDGISVIEHWMPFGEAPPLHIHQREDEVFHILGGVMRFRVGDQEITAGTGDTVMAPKGVPHAFRVESTEGAHCLTIMQGSDFETMLRQASRTAERPNLPEAMTPSSEMIERLVAICAANKIDIVGPPVS
ncbi:MULTISPECIES: cupin domain-containing protein [Rhizobium]|uniref:cupin domain-containing protein n=2 Tax=Rhizobium/Agrobacterium group TaxID=227290 RepID=UPI001105C429|nr:MULTISPECIES: cupin domain-containing protein [Rhizobium]MBX4891221.1 cupin domain-containing protein [Rhizobium bangladeshense]MBX4934211.1 cupin domain-containing protein [Rhizobium bangladeshense]MBY3582829.1 cupin domain-containing protein [Rhizobium bangladeshense]MBY3595389.1 cupin domain-containing protein [Rhizobium bangladeshense]QSY91162.1 cupin domain-containing protein [Rhizobium bangladeshense]